jgi:hypothetical protein
MVEAIWHTRGSVRLPPAIKDSVVLGRVEAALNRQLKSIIESKDGSIEFDDPLGRNFFKLRPNWNTLLLYDQ